MKKILALDLDGTTLNDAGQFSKLTKEALQKARKSNCIIAFVTGRSDVDMLLLKEDWHIADYLIINNGGKILHSSTEKVLKKTLLPLEDTIELISFCLKSQYTLYVVCKGNILVNKLTPGVLAYYKQLKVNPKMYSSLEHIELDAVEVCMATVEGEQVGKFIDNKQLDFTYIASEPTSIDIMKKGTSKWSGICELASRYDIKTENIIAVGNYSNDKDMIVNAGIGVAVKNALPELKEVADYITNKDNNEGAVIEVIERFIL